VEGDLVVNEDEKPEICEDIYGRKIGLTNNTPVNVPPVEAAINSHDEDKTLDSLILIISHMYSF